MSRREKAPKSAKKTQPDVSRSAGPALDRVLSVTVFVTGAAVLVLEIAGSRVLAPYYGSGLYSWSALISVALAALAVGYAGGGRMADRRPQATLFFSLILVAGLLVFSTPWLGRFVLQWTAPLDARLGVLSAAVLLFFPPLLLLGTATPFAIRLARPQEAVLGSVSGHLFAVSTAGSLLAALATGFLLLPNFGVKAILGSTGFVLIVLAGAGLLWERSRLTGAAALAAAVSLMLLPQLDRIVQPHSFKVLDRTPSFYGLIRVIEGDAVRVLTVDGVGQNYVSTQGKVELSPYLALVSALPRLHQRPGGPPRSALVVGLGAGQLVELLEAAGVRVDVVEIDPKIEQAARRHFGFNHPAERVHIADGRVFLEHGVSRYDYVVLDAFLGEDIPLHLFTVEALEAARGRLAAGGLVVVNYTSIPSGRDVAAIGATLRAVFPHVTGYTEGRWHEVSGNVYLASQSPIVLAAEAASGMEGREMIRTFLSHELPVISGSLLTDDFNPINTYRVAASRRWREDMIQFIGADWTFWADF